MVEGWRQGKGGREGKQCARQPSFLPLYYEEVPLTGVGDGWEGGEEEGGEGREGGAAKSKRRREVLKILSQCGY